MKLMLLFGLGLCIGMIACKSAEPESVKMEYPETTKSDHVDTYHGVQVADPYRWLEDDTSAATGAWVEAQNKVTYGFLDKIEWRNDLKKRLESLIN